MAKGAHSTREVERPPKGEEELPNRPTFFFSYARQDREVPGGRLTRFFEDLESRLAGWVGAVLDDRQRLGTIDLRVPHGDNWDGALSRALALNKVFIAVITPLYFNRPNCGKEFSVFVLRNPNLGIDTNGSLTGVANVLLIRWYPETAYCGNGDKDSLIPPILRLIEDAPAMRPRDVDRQKAIERYRKKGMEKCVKPDRTYYGELLDAITESIANMHDLPQAKFPVSFATAYNAFSFDWRKHLSNAGVAISNAQLPISNGQVLPRPLGSVLVFKLHAVLSLVTPSRLTLLTG
jgi:hypothetical protein